MSGKGKKSDESPQDDTNSKDDRSSKGNNENDEAQNGGQDNASPPDQEEQDETLGTYGSAENSNELVVDHISRYYEFTAESQDTLEERLGALQTKLHNTGNIAQQQQAMYDLKEQSDIRKEHYR
ncbi:hypothetical protein EJ02DRAFT_56445 [Clathrospora elynae]|uniref:Uncharacterized protein n=1 Tax=Clathrospora elynae TaxID=706981 RepID=A0A6A5SCX6_9PLEO|nr:hypothetical protein EJ02DRAFT_56445 [Clathrospora elynae]